MNVVIPNWRDIYRETALADLEDEVNKRMITELLICPQDVCSPMWDGASCLPPTMAGDTAVLPCMNSYTHSPGFITCSYSPECNVSTCHNFISQNSCECEKPQY